MTQVNKGNKGNKGAGGDTRVTAGAAVPAADRNKAGVAPPQEPVAGIETKTLTPAGESVPGLVMGDGEQPKGCTTNGAADPEIGDPRGAVVKEVKRKLVRVVLDVPMLDSVGERYLGSPRVDVELDAGELKALRMLRDALEHENAFGGGYVSAGRPVKWLLHRLAEAFEKASAA